MPLRENTPERAGLRSAHPVSRPHPCAERRESAGHFARSPVVHWRNGLAAGPSRIRTSSPTVVFAVARAGRERISISAADSTCLLEGDYRFEPAFPQRAVGGSSFAPRPQRENSAHLRKWDLQFEFRVLQRSVPRSPKRFAKVLSHQMQRSLALASLDRGCRNLLSAFPRRSPPRLLPAAACGALRSAPDHRTRRALLHLSVQLRAADNSYGARNTRP